jgi:hypothetical protein
MMAAAARSVGMMVIASNTAPYEDAESHDDTYHRRGLTAILLSLLEAQTLTQTVIAERDSGHVTVVHVHPVITERADFAPVLDAFQSLTAGERIVWLALSAAMLRVGMGRWEQRTHANGKPKRYSEEEVSRHYGISGRTVYRAWMKADNVMGRAFRDVSWQLRRRED